MLASCLMLRGENRIRFQISRRNTMKIHTFYSNMYYNRIYYCRLQFFQENKNGKNLLDL